MSNKGQSLVEFIIIIAVVVLAGILVLTLFGSNINQMFTKTSQKVDTYKPFGQGVTPSSPSSSSSPSTAPTPASTLNVNGVDVAINTDGSATFTHNGQDVALSAATLNDMSTVIDTAGSDGKEILIAMIQDMIDEHKAEYAPADVPIQILSGNGARTKDGGDGIAYGDAGINLVTIKVGDNYKVFQNDTVVSDGFAAGQFIISGEFGQDAKITNKDGTNVEIAGFYDKSTGESSLKSMKTYEDPTTGKFYLLGQGPDSAGGAGNKDFQDIGMILPKTITEDTNFFNDGNPMDNVWIMEFNPDK